jgi:hypothetical protein
MISKMFVAVTCLLVAIYPRRIANMKRFAVLFAICAGFCAAAPCQESRQVVPAGMSVTARLANQLDSDQAKAGQIVTADVIDDVKINGAVVVPRGALVSGHITESVGRRKMGRGGKLSITFETVTAADGTKVPVFGGNSEKGKGGYGGGSMVAAGAAGFFFPPAGALLLLKHGHSSVIPVGTVLTVQVSADTSVIATIQATTSPVVNPAASATAPPVARPQPAASSMQVMNPPDTTSVAEAARANRARKAAQQRTATPQ